MIITSLEKTGRGRYSIFLDGASAPSFALYAADLKELDLREGSEISSSVLERIEKEILVKRGLLRAGHLIERRDYTEAQIRDKLRAGFYPQASIELIIKRLRELKFLNDDSYAERYTECYIDRKSIGRIKQDLFRKGINKDVIEAAVEKVKAEHSSDGDEYSEAGKIRELLNKRGYDPLTADRSTREKNIAFLLRKGFSFSDIRKVIREADELT